MFKEPQPCGGRLTAHGQGICFLHRKDKRKKQKERKEWGFCASRGTPLDTAVCLSAAMSHAAFCGGKWTLYNGQRDILPCLFRIISVFMHMAGVWRFNSLHYFR